MYVGAGVESGDERLMRVQLESLHVTTAGRQAGQRFGLLSSHQTVNGGEVKVREEVFTNHGTVGEGWREGGRENLLNLVVPSTQEVQWIQTP